MTDFDRTLVEPRTLEDRTWLHANFMVELHSITYEWHTMYSGYHPDVQRISTFAGSFKYMFRKPEYVHP